MQIVLDYETRSEADLKKVGGVKYSQDPSTEILCVGYKVDDGPATIWTGRLPVPKDFLEAARNPKCVWVAHNALFEQCITENVLRKALPTFPALPPARWKCTAAKAAAYALPRALEGACLALDLPVKKNMDGRRLMLRYSKPRRAWLTWKEKGLEPGWVNGEPDKYFEDAEGLKGVYDYCANDVEAEYLLDRAVPDLIPIEREIWLLNQAMNLRGVQVDTETAQIVLSLIKAHVGELEDELRELTGGAVTTVGQRDKLLGWLGANGITLPNLAIKTVMENLDALKTDKSPAKRVLEIRAALAKSSTKKYQAILGRAGRNGRVCDIAMYHGAHTGRESGTGLQLQNLPRGTIKDTNRAIENVRYKDMGWVKCLYGDPMGVFSSCIRGMVTASPDHQLYVADYNAIEARVLAWIAGDEKALENFRKGRDPYALMAADIFSVAPGEVTPEQRDIGKRAELGLGYQMGATKFLETCLHFGAKDVTEELAERAVRIYRQKHSPISSLWPRMERAAIAAVSRPQRAVKLNRVVWGRDKRALWCELPSGRRIHYQAPEVRQEPTPWGEYRPKLYYWSVNSLTKKWECSASYGGLLVENIVQATARDINLWAALRMEKRGYTFLAQVHDELISESKAGDVLEYEKILTESNPWSRDLPIVAKGFKDRRYRK